jgi:two-component system, LuxR family, sensor kinase FixL
MIASDQLNILLVDDQPQKLLAYEAMLDGLGERLLRAQAGNQAFEILLQEEIAVILLDVNMPGMDGFETAALIRDHPRFAKTPIIFVTAVNTTDLDRIRGYEIGAVDYVSVPVIPEILRAKVSVFLELHRKSRELGVHARALGESEGRLRGILDAASDAIITIDQDGLILSINPATERIFGYNAEQLLGKNITLLMPTPYRDEHDGYLRQYLDTGIKHIIGLNREVQGLRKDGAAIPLELAVSEVVPGKVFTGILRDITRRKNLEREVTEIAASQQRQIGQELHDSVSQELTGLTMMASALAERLDGKEPAISALAQRLVEGLGSVHKQIRIVSHGLIPVEVDAEGLRAALEDLTERIRQQAGITCIFDNPRPVIVQDALTATHLFHIAQEATNNALRHGKPTRIDIHLTAMSDALILSIRDNGVGLAPESNQTDGVGLRLMRYRASLIGGVVQIGSSEKGTVVTCTLPAFGNHQNSRSAAPSKLRQTPRPPSRRLKMQ